MLIDSGVHFMGEPAACYFEQDPQGLLLQSCLVGVLLVWQSQTLPGKMQFINVWG